MISIYLITAAVAWLVAQIVKYIIFAIKRGGHWLDTSSVLNSGGMPSVHTATVVAFAGMIGIREGLDSGLFAVSLLLAAVVAYDAMGVRRSSGEQGLALRKLLSSKDKKPYLALGHTPLEVAAGALVGVVICSVVAFFTASI